MLTSKIESMIKENLTSHYDHTQINQKQFIVIHYTANNGDTAYNNTVYYKTDRNGVGAHLFVDDTSIWRSCKDDWVIGHCGKEPGGRYYHVSCRNSNAIGIEMCSRIDKKTGKYYITEDTTKNAIALTKYLMKKYNIPAYNVVRHYDVTHKSCPKPWIENPNLWFSFKAKIAEADHWCDPITETLYDKGIITDLNYWTDYDKPVEKGTLIALIDKATGGKWNSEEANASIHWAQPNLISLCGKKIITDKKQWSDFDSYVTRALTLALVDKGTWGGMIEKYINKKYDYWARANLNSLCDKGIIENVDDWAGHWKEYTSRSLALALIYKAYVR